MNKLNEGLEYKCMVDMIKPTVYVDEFKSKVGDDDAYVVLSFYVHNIVVAEDLVDWFETGYTWVIDADRSPGEIEPNRYLVFVEIKRRTRLIDQIKEMLEDFATLTDLELADWTITYAGEDYPFDEEILLKKLILSPESYREVKEMELNEMRNSAGIPHKNVYRGTDNALNSMRTAAGLPVKTKVVTDSELIQMQRNARIK
jgi:hypothetical protein